MSSGSFTWYEAEKFPLISSFTEYRFSYPTQKGFEEKSMRPPAATDEVFTSIARRENDRRQGYSVFTVTHREPVTVHGWWHNNWVTEIIEESVFDAFFKNKANVFVTHVKKEVSVSATRTLNRHQAELFKLNHREYDFRSVINNCVNLKGAWFSEMKYARISSEAAYGNLIQNDPEFERLLQHGVLRNIFVHIEFENKEVRVNLSRIASTYFLDTFPDDFCLRFLEYMSDFFVPVTGPLFGRGSKQ